MLEFHREADFDTDEHRFRREDGWLGGSYVELPYFLSCLTMNNYVRTPFATWDPAVREYVRKTTPDAAWIAASSYFHDFAVLILRELYRQSELGRQYPIRPERRPEKATRFVICHPALTLEELASQFGTTVKQLQRNSTAMLAFREYRRLSDSPS